MIKIFFKKLIPTVNYIYHHPMNNGNRFKAVIKFLKWQIAIRLQPCRIIFDWVDGSKFILQKGEKGLSGNLYCGLMEHEDMAFLLHYLESDNDFYDIGANVGAYTILASSVIGCKTYSFEPIPSTYERLIDQINLNRIDHLVCAKNSGIGEKIGELEFTTNLNCMNKVNLDPNNENITKVSVSTLDTEFKPKKKSLIKIDVEGYEKYVLQGGKSFFLNDNVQALIVELNNNGIEYGIEDIEIDTIIRSFNFIPVKYNPFHRKIERIESFNVHGNTIYLKNLEDAEYRVKKSKKFTIHTANKTSI